MLNSFNDRFLTLKANESTSFDDCMKLLDDVIAQFNKDDFDSDKFFDIIAEIDNFVWKKYLSDKSLRKSYSEYINNIFSWKVEKVLNQKKNNAINFKSVERVQKYNDSVDNFVARNIKNNILSVGKIGGLGIVNLIDPKTFKEYTPNFTIENWFKVFKYYHGHGVGIPFEYRKSINLQYLKNKSGKINLEENFGDIMTTEYKLNSGDHIAFDTMLDLVNNSPEEMDFCFDTINKNNEQVGKVFLGFRQMYDEWKFDKFNEQYFLYLGSYIVPFYREKGDFDTLYKILSKRIDFLLSNRYGYPKIEIDQKQKDKLIIQTLMYGSGSLHICGSINDKQTYKTLSMLTGNENFADGYKFSLGDIQNIILCTQQTRSVHCVDVLKFCVKNLNGDVKLYEVVNSMHGMGIKIKDAEHELCSSKTIQICLPNERYRRLNGVLPITKESEVFDNEDYLKVHIQQLPKDEKEFDKWFLFFEETHPYFYQTSLNQADKKVKNFFIQVINCIPDNYLSLEKFNSLMDYFVKRHKEYVNVAKIDLTVEELVALVSKINWQMDKWNQDEVTDKMQSCITIFDQEISKSGVLVAIQSVTKMNELKKQLADIQKDSEEVSDNDGIFAKAWDKICNTFLKFVCNIQLWALESKIKKACKESQEKNNSQGPNNEIKINKEANSFLGSVAEVENESIPSMQPGSKEQKK